MSIFDEQAIEAARKCKRHRILAYEDTKEILRAAEASLRDRGMLTAQVPSGADCHPESPHAQKEYKRKLARLFSRATIGDAVTRQPREIYEAMNAIGNLDDTEKPCPNCQGMGYIWDFDGPGAWKEKCWHCQPKSKP